MTKGIIGTMAFQKGDGFDANAFNKMIEEGYLKESRPDAFKTKKSFSPSNVGYGHGTCPRYWFIAFNGEEFIEVTDAQSIANMANGSASHERIQRVMRHTGLVEDTEIELRYSDPPIFGYVDVIIKWNGHRVVGEIKTTRQEAFEWRASTGKPAAYHLLQILIYMYILDINEGFLLYENKNDHTLHTIVVRMNNKNRQIVEDAFGWMKYVYSLYTEDTLPKRPFRKNNKICTHCPVFDACYNKWEQGVIEVPALEVQKP